MQYLEGENRIYIPNPNGGEDIAEMTYIYSGEDWAVINHTYVDVNYRGQGIADKLLVLVLDKLKKENRKVTASCVYVSKQFERHPELKHKLSGE